MANKKKSAKIKRFEKQVKANITNALKTHKKLELELSKVEKHIKKMMSWAWETNHDGRS